VRFVIVFLVAAHAGLGDVFVLVVDVTLQAFDLNVLAHQLEFGLVVFEACGLPIFIGMALGAIFTELTLVRFFIIFLMAGEAQARRLTELFSRFMAALTFHFLSQVPTLENEICQLVIE
jgi:hypothetical protein